jgi:prepilin peptidase CpaA
MSLLDAVQTACLIAFAALLLAAAWQDLRTMKIADGISVGIVACFAVWAGIGLVEGSFGWMALAASLVCGLGAFALGAIAFATGSFGGGDVKLAAVVSLFAGPALVIDFAMVTALAGGLMGVAILAGAPIGPTTGGDSTLRARLSRSLPYGPAISLGGLWVAASLAGL